MFASLVRYLQTKLDAIHRLAVILTINVEKIMINLDALTAANADLRAKVDNLTTVTAGVVANENQHAANMKALADEIAALKAGTSDAALQAQIDALAQTTRDAAAGIEKDASDLAASITTGTAAAAEPTTEPVPPPTPPTP